MRATIQITENGTAFIGGEEHHATQPGESRNPFLMRDTDCTLEYVQSELLGPTILVADGQGRPLYGINVRRPGMYVVDENGHTYVDVPIPATEPTLV